MRASKAKRLRALIEVLADFLEDEEAVEAAELFQSGCARWYIRQRYRMPL